MKETKTILLFFKFSVTFLLSKGQTSDSFLLKRSINYFTDTFKVSINSRITASSFLSKDTIKGFSIITNDINKINTRDDFYDVINLAKDLNGKNQIYFELADLKKDKTTKTVFVISNPFKKELKYKVKIKLRNKQQFLYPNISPISPGIANIELWSELIEYAILYDFILSP